MEYNLRFEKLCEKLNLGELTTTPIPLAGGHLHRMFALETNLGKYAVKALNPGVMQRPEAMGNLIRAERVAEIAAKHIPAIPALVFNETAIQEIDGQYYYVFEWVDGGVLQNNELLIIHSEIMGGLLADLHRTDFTSLGLVDDYSYKESEVDWNFYLQKGIEQSAVWVQVIKDNIWNLQNWNRRLIHCAVTLSAKTVISHGDLEPKNVIWNNSAPFIIDWEAAGFVAPSYDLFEAAVYWAKDMDNRIQKDRFTAFLKAYKRKNAQLDIDYDAVLDKGFSRLGWLAYSLRRSLGIECADETEKQMGTDHVFWSLNDLLQYEKMFFTLKDWLMEAWNG